MSGTSMDGVDAALVALTAKSCSVVAAYTTPYEKSLREALHQASRNPAQCGLDEFGRLDRQVADAFTAATVELLADAGIAKSAVTAIGSHGQTIRHRPRSEFPFTIQIGDPNVIAAGTGITTVADFRRRDIALGGEGAPLAPAFHHWLFAHADLHRVVLNLGGFANITVLQAGQSSTFGFDTGPGNTLMDAWCMQQLGESFDAEGHWAASGKINKPLLRRMLDDAYFAAAPPKSTGFEYFNLAWLAKHIDGSNIDAADVQATLCELTVQSVAAAISRHAPETNEVWLCGGGARNSYLVSRMRETLVPASLKSTSELGVAPDWIEAAAFAWLAACRLANQTGNLPDVTGAREAAILGGIYAGRPAAPGP
ncbi:MAG: anhydro-N-acetylmuramic acid kinase [Woeseia sp.]|nr:anhydro-N-acetylmuramic acid kinase [Woeseia sp.]MBT8096909.1 anhydro-N-acetylmuramic acid kinase [Woeseia sp.]NNE61615.1 anhydro-N-acetylmuramic acid kinase [Woeseia sp.]NNL55464.1 anhydro-N-acetylmuramic acid kinase [Woeseia sp.]